jgi:transposase
MAYLHAVKGRRLKMGELITMNKKELQRIKTLNRLINKGLKQYEAAEDLGISIRQVKRLLKFYKERGELAVLSKKRGKASNRQLAQNLESTALALIEHNYRDFGPTLAYEKLTEEHSLKLSISTVRNIMIKNHLWEAKKPRKAIVHQMRERRAQEGDLVQIDGSLHDWFEGRSPKCTLLVYIDDATGKLLYLYFTEVESTQSYFKATRQYIEKHGRPISFYSDKHGVFKVNAKEAISGDGLTKLGRAMKDFSIKIICANSPQAKGRVEKVNRTLQDRLVKELRLQNISNIEDANAFLPMFIEKFNKKFAVVPRNPLNAHRNIEETHNLDEIFSLTDIFLAICTNII